MGKRGTWTKYGNITGHKITWAELRKLKTLHFKFLVQSLYETPKPIKPVHLGPGDLTCLTNLPDEGVDGTHFKLPSGFGLREVTCHPRRGWMMRHEITYVARFIN